MRVDEYVPDWSDITPGSPFAMYCSLRHWDFNPAHTSAKSIKECLETANDCDDYTIVEHVNLQEQHVYTPVPIEDRFCHRCHDPLTRIYTDNDVLQVYCLSCSKGVLVD